MALLVWVSLAFQRTLLKVSMKRSAWPLDDMGRSISLRMFDKILWIHWTRTDFHTWDNGVYDPKPGADFYGGCFCRQSTTFAGFYCILDAPVHICPIDIASDKAFHPRHSEMADMKLFEYSFLQCRRCNYSIFVHHYFITDRVSIRN